MAFSKSLQKGQIAICCKLCETETKIRWKCIDCDLLMCSRCQEIIHPNIRNARNHKVVDIKEFKLNETEELDFSNLQCNEHKSQVCVMFCKSCDQLVCPPCIAKIHTGHVLVEIREGYQIQAQRLKDGQNQTKINIDEFTKAESKMIEIQKVEHDKYMEAREKILDQNISLKKAVDQDTEKLINELDKKWQTLKTCIEKDRSRVTSLRKDNMDNNNRAEEVINSNDVRKMFNETKELEKCLQEAEKPLEVKFNSMPTFAPTRISQFNIGSLHVQDITLKVIKEYTTNVSRIYLMSPCVDSLWISDQNIVQHIQLEVNNLKVVASFDIEVFGIAVTPSNDLLLARKGKSVLEQISCSTGQLMDTNYGVDKLCITTVHVTSDYQVVVGARDYGEAFPVSGRRVVISMDKTGSHKTIYENDKNIQRIFSYPRRITCTKDGNICVVDMLSYDNKGRVVVLGQNGDVLNIFNGHPDLNTEQKPFKPASLVTTPSDNVIVPDTDSGVLHILSNVGYLMTHINTRDIIQSPYSIAFTTTGKVYIGCTIKRGTNTNAKLYEALLTGY